MIHIHSGHRIAQFLLISSISVIHLQPSFFFYVKLHFIQGINSSQTQQFITNKIYLRQHVSTLVSHHQAFQRTDPMYQNLQLSGLPKNRSNVSKFIVRSGIPECTINFDTLDLFFGRPDNDSIESKHVVIGTFCVINYCV